jgi:hypothetical protein
MRLARKAAINAIADSNVEGLVAVLRQLPLDEFECDILLGAAVMASNHRCAYILTELGTSQAGRDEAASRYIGGGMDWNPDPFLIAVLLLDRGLSAPIEKKLEGSIKESVLDGKGRPDADAEDIDAQWQSLKAMSRGDVTRGEALLEEEKRSSFYAEMIGFPAELPPVVRLVQVITACPLYSTFLGQADIITGSKNRMPILNSLSLLVLETRMLARQAGPA